MGHSTILSVNHDRVSEALKDPSFGEDFYNLVMDFANSKRKVYNSVVTPLVTGHRDWSPIVRLEHLSKAEVLTYDDPISPEFERMLVATLRARGYRVSKPKEKIKADLG